MSATHQFNAVSNRRLGEVASKTFRAAGILGVAGIGVSILIALSIEGGWERFYRSYLMAFMFVLSISLGAMFFIILQHAVKAGWSVVLRRLAEGVAGNLMWIWVLFIPIAIGMLRGKLYPWNPLNIHDEALVSKAAYLNPTFWLIRAAVFFAIWAALAKFFVGSSIAQDATGDLKHTYRMQRFAPLAVLLYGLSQTYASIDWIMSLSPHWFSTMFPVYFFAASCCGYFSLQIVMMFFVQRNGRLRSEITPEHYQDAGKLLFAFGIVFWAYIGFSQYMLIWYANIPEETPWYMTRQTGGWLWVVLLLLFGHFVGPFLLIISRYPKRIAAVLTAAAMWMLFMHFMDIYWLVMPKVPRAVHYIGDHVEWPYRILAEAVSNPNSAAGELIRKLPEYRPGDLDNGFGWHLLDLTCLAGMAGLLIAGTAQRLGGCSLIPERDPRLHESLAFENI